MLSLLLYSIGIGVLLQQHRTDWFGSLVSLHLLCSCFSFRSDLITEKKEVTQLLSQYKSSQMRHNRRT